MSEFDAKKFGAIVNVPFTIANATTGLDNADLLAAGGVNTLWTAPRSGSVIGISAATAAITAGTITLKAHKAGTEFTEAGVPAPVLSSTADTNGVYANVRPNLIRFAAGDTLGISATSTTTLNPTNTLDVEASLFVILDA
jgi:hypothetical protein